MLAEQIGVAEQTVRCHLHVFKTLYKLGKWIPHELTDAQKSKNFCLLFPIATAKNAIFRNQLSCAMRSGSSTTTKKVLLYVEELFIMSS
jgi:hypothetical protein